MTVPVIVIGAGGHARVVIDALQRAGIHVSCATDADPARHGQTVLGVPIAGDDGVLARYAPGTVQLALGVGSVGDVGPRRAIFERWAARGYRFVTVRHPSAVVAPDVELLEGAQVMAGAVVQTGSRIGRNAIVNTGACVDHDCRVGDHAHIAPRAVLAGGVDVGVAAHVGAGATVIQSVRIGAGSLVAAGAVVIRDVPDGARVMGVPAGER